MATATVIGEVLGTPNEIYLAVEYSSVDDAKVVLSQLQ
jgi:hypothetical protein